MTIIVAFQSIHYQALAADILLTTKTTGDENATVESMDLPLKNPALEKRFQIYGKTAFGVGLTRKITRISTNIVLAWAGPVDLAEIIIRGFKNNIDDLPLSQPEALNLLKYLWTYIPSGRTNELNIIGLCHDNKSRGVFAGNATAVNLPNGEKLYIAGSGAEHYYKEFLNIYNESYQIIGDFGANHSMQQFLSVAFQTIQKERINTDNLDHLYGGYIDCVQLARDKDNKLFYENLPDTCLVYYIGEINKNLYMDLGVHHILLFHTFFDDALVIVRVDMNVPGDGFCTGTIFPVYELDRYTAQFDQDTFLLRKIQPNIHVVSFDIRTDKAHFLRTMITGDSEIVNFNFDLPTGAVQINQNVESLIGDPGEFLKSLGLN